MRTPQAVIVFNYNLFFGAGAGRSVKSWDLLADNRILGSFVDVDLRPVCVILGHVSVGENCFDRALRYARITIDASVGIDVKTIS